MRIEKRDAHKNWESTDLIAVLDRWVSYSSSSLSKLHRSFFCEIEDCKYNPSYLT